MIECPGICRARPRSRQLRSTTRYRWSQARRSSPCIRNDPLARLHSRRQIDEARYQAGRAFQSDWEKAERGPRAVDPTREYVDGGQGRGPITEGQRRAVLRLYRAERELGADGSALVHDVLVQGMTMEQVGQRRGLFSKRWSDYFSRRLRECLDRLALLYGFAQEQPVPVNPLRTEARNR